MGNKNFLTLTFCLSIILWHGTWQPLLGQGTETPSNSHIVFSSDRDGDYEIYTMRPDGTDIQQLTFNDSTDSDPDWSPDGSRIAFENNSNGRRDIFVMNSDGSNLVNVTNTEAMSENTPNWSPDAQHIAFSGSTSEGANIYIMDPAGGNVTLLIDSSTAIWNLFPTWSPDGSELAFVATNNLISGGETGGSLRLMKVNVELGLVVEIARLEQYANPDWSWSNDRIAFYDLATFYTGVRTINSDGTGRVSINNETFPDQELPYPRADENPAWSPDGNFFVFDTAVYSDTDPNYSDRDIYIMGVDGTNVVNLTPNTSSNDVQPDWQPIQ